MHTVREVQIEVAGDTQQKEWDQWKLISVGEPREDAVKFDAVAEASDRRRLHAAQQNVNIPRLRAIDNRR
jgi:hypothetical protein